MALVETKSVTIAPPQFHDLEFPIRGVAPYVQNKFSAKAKEQMHQTQAAGSTSRKGKAREAKDFEAAFRASLHVADDGWYGIPAPAFRDALISSCRLVGFQMTRAKLAVFVVADGFDRDEGTPLVRITKGEPRYHEAFVRNETGVVDLRARGMWAPGWEAVVHIRADVGQFTPEDVANLMLRAGMQVGIGEGRPDSPKSNGQGWGLFELVEG